MSKQLKSNYAGCLISLLGLNLLLFGASIIVSNFGNQPAIIPGFVILLLGFGLFSLPLLWAKNIAYDKDGNEIYWRNEKELEEKIGRRHL
jgi:hypothetical protein